MDCAGFTDDMSGQWSYYMARFRSAARLAPAKDVEIGGYIVGRTASSREIQLKTLSQIAGGAKNIRYYTFGPEYNFPGQSIFHRCGYPKCYLASKLNRARFRTGF